MRQFDDCWNLRCSINEIDGKIRELQELNYAPRNQVLSGMPRGGGGNSIEQYVIRIDKYNQKKKHLQKKLDNLWDETVKLLEENGIEDENIILMRYHFYVGLSWSECSKKMKNEYPAQKWYRQKCYGRYESVIYKINKNR